MNGNCKKAAQAPGIFPTLFSSSVHSSLDVNRYRAEGWTLQRAVPYSVHFSDLPNKSTTGYVKCLGPLRFIPAGRVIRRIQRLICGGWYKSTPRRVPILKCGSRPSSICPRAEGIANHIKTDVDRQNGEVMEENWGMANGGMYYRQRGPLLNPQPSTEAWGKQPRAELGEYMKGETKANALEREKWRGSK
ncbi:hypothetical protein C8R44DRAFT_736555 [Mycena epipterygia]|nr:hypothetical protein C8R44DRAFT_736555 [Mycena epipterygia]